jgi:hypothetical protein
MQSQFRTIQTDQILVNKTNLYDLAKKALEAIDKAESDIWQSWADFGYILSEGKKIHKGNIQFSQFLERNGLNKLPSGRTIAPAERSAAIWMVTAEEQYLTAKTIFPEVTTPRGLHFKYREMVGEINLNAGAGLNYEVEDFDVIDNRLSIKPSKAKSLIESKIIEYILNDPTVLEVVVAVLVKNCKTEEEKQSILDEIIMEHETVKF